MAKQTQQQEPDKPSPSYISRVRLKGYKSIIDTEVTFKPGLNIIIGANGSGKTNFVEFLRQVLHLKINEISKKYEVDVEFVFNRHHCQYQLSYMISPPDNFNISTGKIDEKFIIDYKINFQRNNEYQPKIASQIEWRNLYPIYILFGIPIQFNNIENLIEFEILPASAIFMDSPNPDLIISWETKPPVTDGLNRFLREIFQNHVKLDQETEEIPILFKTYLKRFTPIKDIRLAPNYNISRSHKGGLLVQYIKFEFLLNNQWLTWNQLSDGTKRIFYIITEVTFANNVILLEEPELGIHPHQLIRLMDFIKEQSETKQIILTTHSPEVLNALKMNELDQIIVARYDKEKGTQMSHLSDDDMEHARSYMKDKLFLSDFWVMSGFETEGEEA